MVVAVVSVVVVDVAVVSVPVGATVAAGWTVCGTKSLIVSVVETCGQPLRARRERDVGHVEQASGREELAVLDAHEIAQPLKEGQEVVVAAR